MLEDVVRTTSYDDALLEVVKPESRVIDFGTGTGVLSIFSARHGAAHVDAVDRSSFIRNARRIAKDSGHPEIRFHHADHKTLALEEKADILVSEWMGHCLFFEAMMGPLLAVRDKWLKPDGVMVPAQVSVHAALVTDEAFHEERRFFLGNPYGIDFSSIAEKPLRQSRLIRIEEAQMDSRTFHLGTIDMKTVKEQPRSLRGSCTVRQATIAYGVVAWFDTQLTDLIRFGTGPRDAPTHWEQIFFPFPEPFIVVPDRQLDLEIRPPSESEHEDPTWYWSLSDGEERVEVDEKVTFSEASRDPNDEEIVETL